MARKPATKTRRTAARTKTTKRAAAAKQTLDLKDLDHPLIRLLTVLSANNADMLKKIGEIKDEVGRLSAWCTETDARLSRLVLRNKRDDVRKSDARIAANSGSTYTSP